MDIRIDLKKVTNVNNELIPIITRLSIVHRSLNLTKWKLDENMERYTNYFIFWTSLGDPKNIIMAERSSISKNMKI